MTGLWSAVPGLLFSVALPILARRDSTAHSFRCTGWVSTGAHPVLRGWGRVADEGEGWLRARVWTSAALAPASSPQGHLPPHWRLKLLTCMSHFQNHSRQPEFMWAPCVHTHMTECSRMCGWMSCGGGAGRGGPAHRPCSLLVWLTEILLS